MRKDEGSPYTHEHGSLHLEHDGGRVYRKREASNPSQVWASFNGSVAPADCDVMIGFNAGSAGKDACDLCRKLNEANVKTFCTGLYCEAAGAGSDWDEATAVGIASCMVLVTLMTEGWRVSPPCNHETKMATMRLVERVNPLRAIVPVVYPDFDAAKDKDSKGGGKQWLLRVGAGVQQIYTAGKSSDDWMAAVVCGARCILRPAWHDSQYY